MEHKLNVVRENQLQETRRKKRAAKARRRRES
jgi:hypothetical protein